MGETTTRRPEMNARRHTWRLMALALVLAVPVVGLSGVASAKAAKAAHTSATKAARKCLKHPKRVVCQVGGGAAGGGGTAGSPAAITVTASPNPLVEVAQSNIDAVLQVETSPAFAGAPVVISSSQLTGSCEVLYFGTTQGATGGNLNFVADSPITVALDNDGNATVIANGINCAPGSDLIDASLADAPFATALTTLVVEPPQVTAPGVTGSPNPEVETGNDGPAECEEVVENDPCEGRSLGSDVYAVFYVETNPVYAEQAVEISDNQLSSSCIGGSVWYDSYTNPVDPVGNPTTILDDDGNAVFVFVGTSCAAGTTDVIADVLAGDHPTYVTTYTVDPPAPTI
jgi:hypothetical protein